MSIAGIPAHRGRPLRWLRSASCLVFLASAAGATHGEPTAEKEHPDRVVIMSMQVRHVDCFGLENGDGLSALMSAVQGAIMQKASCWVDVSIETSKCAPTGTSPDTSVMLVARVEVPPSAGEEPFQLLSHASSDYEFRQVLEARVAGAAGVRAEGDPIVISDLGTKLEDSDAAREIFASDPRVLVPKQKSGVESVVQVPPPPAEGSSSFSPGLVLAGLLLIALGLGAAVLLSMTATCDEGERPRPAGVLMRRAVPEHSSKPVRWQVLV